MIYGVGVDIPKVSRFKKWVENPAIISRFFNEEEMSAAKSLQAQMEHYAVRFAAKEAFGKALGTGVTAFNLKDVYVIHSADGRPELCVQGDAKKLLEERVGNFALFISLSHEKEYAVANVIIEK